MATLTIRQLDDGVYERLKVRAKSNGRSLEAEARAVIEDKTADVPALVEDLREFHERMKAKHGLLPDSVDLIRQMRDEE